MASVVYLRVGVRDVIALVYSVFFYTCGSGALALSDLPVTRAYVCWPSRHAIVTPHFFLGFTTREIFLWCMIIIIRTFIKRHKSRHIHSEALYMSKYICVVEL